MIELYAGTMTIFPAKIRVALAEKRIDFSPHWVEWTEDGGYEMPEFVLQTNPMGQLPVLVDNGFAIYDSTIICEYLEERFPNPPLYPQELQAKTRCRQLENEGDVYLFSYVSRFYPDERVPGEMAKAQDGLNTAFERLDSFLAKDKFLCGDFSIADIATYLPLAYGKTMGVKVDEHFQNLHRWQETMAARQSVAAVLQDVAASARVANV